MDKYTISLFSGDKITLSEKQYKQLVQLWDAGAEEFSFGERRFSRKAVAYIGSHQSTPQIKQWEENSVKKKLSGKELRKIRVNKLKKARIAHNKQKRQETEDGLRQLYEKIKTPEKLPMRSGEEENGDPMYWVNEDGERLYS